MAATRRLLRRLLQPSIITTCLVCLVTTCQSFQTSTVNLVRNAPATDVTGFVGSAATLICPINVYNSDDLSVSYRWYRYDYTQDPLDIQSLDEYQVAVFQRWMHSSTLVTYNSLKGRANVDDSTGDLIILSSTINDTYNYVCSFVPGGYGQVRFTVREESVAGGSGVTALIFAVLIPLVVLVSFIVSILLYNRRHRFLLEKVWPPLVASI